MKTHISGRKFFYCPIIYVECENIKRAKICFSPILFIMLSSNQPGDIEMYIEQVTFVDKLKKRFKGKIKCTL